MLKTISRSCLIGGCLCLSTFLATAQEVVHALTGTVSAIDPAAKTMKVQTDDGSEGLFQVIAKPTASLQFSKKIRDETTPAEGFTKTGAHVLVFYFGNSYVERKAIALLDLGAGPFIKTSGTVVKFDKHEHRVTIKDSSSAEQSFEIGPNTVVGTAVGPIDGYKFDPEEGSQLQVTASSAGGTNMALFIRAQ
jgi:hypothetical protein